MNSDETIIIQHLYGKYQLIINGKVAGLYDTLHDCVDAAQSDGKLCGGKND